MAISTGKAMDPVLVVGAGPVGLILAYMLGQLQVPVIVLDRHRSRLDAPKASVLQSRSLEICRQAGLDTNVIRSKGTPLRDARWVRFMISLAGEEIGRLPLFPTDPDVLEYTPEISYNIAQPDFEKYVASEMPEAVDIRRGWTWRFCTQDESGVTSTLENTYTGEKQEVRSSLVVACDGANSKIVHSMGVPIEVQDTTDHIMTIHFEANVRKVVKDHEALLYWVVDPRSSGAIIAYDLESNFVLLHNYDGSQQAADSFTTERCTAAVLAAIGAEVPVKIHNAIPWQVRQKVVEKMYSGRVLFAGDAAHSFPPTGGFGLNTGIHDAHNLAVKIGGIYKGWTTVESALSAYHDERQPIGLRNGRQAIEYGKISFDMVKAFKLTDPDIERAVAGMHAAMKDPQERKHLEHVVDIQYDQFNSTNMHMGYVYEQGYTPETPTEFVPAFRKGARLGHAWIQPSEKIPEGIAPANTAYLEDAIKPYQHRNFQYSTLDLVSPSTFAIFHSSAGADLAGAIAAKMQTAKIPVGLTEVGKDFSFAVSEEDQVAGKKWLAAYGIDQGGVLVVRPDQFVAAVVGSTDGEWDVSDLL